MPANLSQLVQYIFACDCAERLFNQIGNQNRIDEQTFKTSLASKRKWLDLAQLKTEPEDLWRASSKIDSVIEDCESTDAGVFVFLAYAVYEAVYIRIDKDNDAKRSFDNTIENIERVYERWQDEPGAEQITHVEKQWRQRRLEWLTESYELAGERLHFLIRDGHLKPPEDAALDWQSDVEALRQWAPHNFRR